MFMAIAEGPRHIFHEDGISTELDMLLERLYQSPFSTTRFFTLFRNAARPNALVISYGDNVPRHVLAYTVNGREVTLLNELVAVEQEYLLYFADAVFARYPGISVINFNCMKGRIAEFAYPWRQWRASQDIAIALPRSIDEYHAKLGVQTRKHIKYYINRLQKLYGEYTFETIATENILPSSISSIIEFNRQRMKDKNITSGFDVPTEKKVAEFCRYYGLTSVVSIHGRIIAGTICYDMGDHVYLEIVSHDSEFNKCNAGQVCLYLTIKELIDRGKITFHMLWGENEYKFRFLGVQHNLSFLSVYRSPFAKLADTPKVVRTMGNRMLLQVSYVKNKYLSKEKSRGK
jgi:hypothetical protein